MYEFQYSQSFWFLLLLPLIVLMFVAYQIWIQRQKRKIGSSHLVETQLTGNIKGRKTLKFSLIATAFLFIIIGLANLRKPEGASKIERSGLDVMVALDVSKSMLATDISPNRLTRAKQLIYSLTEQMPGDRMGLIIFAGRAYLQTPLTVDYSALRMMLQTVGPNSVPTQGTVLGDAIEMANRSFSNKEKKYKLLVVISDGEDHDEKALSAVKEAKENGVIVFTIGIGSPDGTILMDPGTGQPILDEQGEKVISKLNESLLKDLAKRGQGKYYELSNPTTVAKDIVKEVASMEKRSIGTFVYANYHSYFQYFLIVGLLLLVIEQFIPSAKRK